MTANIPSHVTLAFGELCELLRRGSPSHRRCLSCNWFAMLPQDRSWCDACTEKYRRLRGIK